MCDHGRCGDSSGSAYQVARTRHARGHDLPRSLALSHPTPGLHQDPPLRPHVGQPCDDSAGDGSPSAGEQDPTGHRCTDDVPHQVHAEPADRQVARGHPQTHRDQPRNLPFVVCSATTPTFGVARSDGFARRPPATLRIATGQLVASAAPPAPPNPTIAEPRRPSIGSVPSGWGALPQSPYSLCKPFLPHWIARPHKKVWTAWPPEANGPVAHRGRLPRPPVRGLERYAKKAGNWRECQDRRLSIGFAYRTTPPQHRILRSDAPMAQTN